MKLIDSTNTRHISYLVVLFLSLNVQQICSQELDRDSLIVGSNDYQEAMKIWLDNSEPKIIGGLEASKNQLPWQVSLDISRVADPYRAHFCGGTIYNEEWIVTAAHCVDGNRPEDIIVSAGMINLRDTQTRENVIAIYVIEGYVQASEGKDIALLKLKNKLVYSESIQAIPLLKDDIYFNEQTEFTISGWGATSQGGSQSLTLRYIEKVPYVTRDTCNLPLSYDGKITEDMICSGFAGGGIDSCQGDSGGPHIIYTRDGEKLSGIVSWGYGCAQPLKYGVYTRVSSYFKWVESCVAGTEYCKTKN